MAFFQRKSAFDKEWDDLVRREGKFGSQRHEKKDSLLNQKLEGKIPEKLQSTLDAAFFKAFELIFEKGTGLIEKTYNRNNLQAEFHENAQTAATQRNRKSLRAFSKKAKGSGNTNLLISGASGIGLGVLGIGLPDIALFTSMMLRSLYEISLNFGYQYESDEERYFILLIIQGSVSYGEDYERINTAVDRFISDGRLPEHYDRKQQIRETAGTLSKELLYMKFLQGIPIVGAIGGAYDAIYMKRVTEYANLKYKRRFLSGGRGGLHTIIP